MYGPMVCAGEHEEDRVEARALEVVAPTFAATK
jgi:hypothetical protein